MSPKKNWQRFLPFPTAFSLSLTSPPPRSLAGKDSLGVLHHVLRITPSPIPTDHSHPPNPPSPPARRTDREMDADTLVRPPAPEERALIILICVPRISVDLTSGSFLICMQVTVMQTVRIETFLSGRVSLIIGTRDRFGSGPDDRASIPSRRRG